MTDNPIDMAIALVIKEPVYPLGISIDSFGES